MTRVVGTGASRGGPYHGQQGQRRQAPGRLGAGHGLPPVLRAKHNARVKLTPHARFQLSEYIRQGITLLRDSWTQCACRECSVPFWQRPCAFRARARAACVTHD